MAGNFIVGQIRTYVPIIIGAGIGWLVAQGVLDPEAAEAAQNAFVVGVTALSQGVYYFLVRVLAEKWSWIGYFLGYNKAPDYQTPPAEREGDVLFEEDEENLS